MLRRMELACVLSMIATQASVTRAQQVTLAAQAQTNAAVFRNQVGRRVTFVCPAQVNINQDVYGTDVYTDTSPICAAAAHAGLFTRGTSAAVTIEMEGERQSFTASTRNSVTSLAYGPWSGTYSFVRDGRPGQIDWNTTIVAVTDDYLTPITLVCPPAGQSERGVIWGSDVYPDDSAICVAGVHAGAISITGGALTITRVAKQASFPSITRNDITSRMWSDPAWRSYPQPYSVAVSTVPATVVGSTGSAPGGTTNTTAGTPAVNAVLVQPGATTGTATPIAAPVTGVTTTTPTTATGMTTTIPTASAPTAARDSVSRTTQPISSAPTTSAAFDPGMLVGTGMSDITGPIAEVVMMGYADGDQQAAGIHTRLYARAFIFANPKTNKRVVWVSAELGQLFSSIKQGVLKKLATQYGTLYTNENVMISATHTHSGPGGYSHHTIYNLTIKGFVKQNYDMIVDGITEAIGQAHRRLAPGGVSMIPNELDEQTMVNRSKVAFALNLEAMANPPASPINRSMTLLKILSGGRPLGAIAFHAVHNTSMPRTNRLISSDHKGYAAYLFEKQFGSVAPFQKYGDFIAAFPNGAEGDMSPNLDTTQVTVFTGPDKDPFESTRIIGTREFNAAFRLFNSSQATPLSTEVDYRHKFVMMGSGTTVPTSIYTNGQGTKALCTGAYGVSFAAGAEDGRPDGDFFREGSAFSSQFDKTMLDATRAIAIGVATALLPPVSAVLTPTSSAFMAASADQCQYPKPILLPTGYLHWTPEILPFQVFRIGSLAIAGIPGEMTVQAGRRLEAAIKTAMAPLGITHVVLTGLANEYSGYITTPEEYVSQQYEGASTLYGRLTFDAYKEAFQDLGFAMAGSKEVASGPSPDDLSGAQIQWASKLDHDERPALEAFGQVLVKPDSQVNRGTNVQVIFRSANPNNAPRRNDSYFRIERDLGGDNWSLVAWDATPDTKMHWALTLSPILDRTGQEVGQACPGDPCLWSTTGIVWSVPADATPGRYRIRLFGSWKHGETRQLTPFIGTTEPFTVR